MMEPRSVFVALRFLAETNVLLVCAFLVARAIATWSRGSRRHRLRCAQAVFVLAFVLPIAVRAVPHRLLVPAAAQVWSSGDDGRSATAAATVVGTTRRIGGGEITLDNRILAFLLAGLVAVAVARVSWLASRLFLLHRRLDALPSIRRLGHVSIVATHSQHVPFAAWLFGRAYVAIPETLVTATPAHYAMVVRHELAHHRQRDTTWIVAFEVASALTLWNPATRTWSRLFTQLMELACDEALVVGRRVDPRSYAACLADTARAALAAAKPRHVLATTEMAALDDSFLRKRIEIMLAPRITPRRAIFASLAALLVLTSSAFALQNSLQDRVIGAAQARELAARAQSPDFAVVMNDQVLARLNRLVGTPEGREFVQGALQRLPEHRAGIEQRLDENGMPTALVAVALVESGFRNNEGFPAEPTLAPGLRGSGIWMFVPATARRYGLVVQPSSGIDERLDVAKETDAAIAYLRDLYRQFGDWPLALAAYNQGERRVTRVIGDTGSRDPFVLAERGLLNDYVATVMAGAVVLANPAIVW